MELQDIKNAITPISLGGLLKYGPRVLWKHRYEIKAASTPLHDSADLPPKSQYALNLEINSLDGSHLELVQSPILTVHPKISIDSIPIFGRELSLESDKLNSTRVARELENMKILEKSGDNSSNSYTEKFKKQVDNNRKLKLSSPKYKGGNVKKIGKLKSASEITKKRTKSPKSNSPKGFKIGPFRKTVSSVSSLKKCAKSPKLQTAIRAMIKQQREEIRKEKEKIIEIQKNKLLEEQKQKEEQEILKMRQETIFRAKPIRKYAPLPQVKKRLLTEPISPNLCKRRRIASSSYNSNSNSMK